MKIKPLSGRCWIFFREAKYTFVTDLYTKFYPRSDRYSKLNVL